MEHLKQLKAIIFVILGIVLMTLGIIGIFIPILPATPFLLAASWFFIRSSRKLNQWLLSHRLFGRYILNYSRYRAVDLKSKQLAIILLWAGMLTSIHLLESVPLKVILALIGLAVTYHILSLRTLTPELQESLDEQLKAGEAEAESC